MNRRENRRFPINKTFIRLRIDRSRTVSPPLIPSRLFLHMDFFVYNDYWQFLRKFILRCVSYSFMTATTTTMSSNGHRARLFLLNSIYCYRLIFFYLVNFSMFLISLPCICFCYFIATSSSLSPSILNAWSYAQFF